MKKLFFVLLLALCTACTKVDPNSFKKHINGYWEIDRVVLSTGEEKEYNFNQSIDFFELKDTIGTRKKVQPKIDGNFIVTRDSETFIVKIENDSLRMFYTTPLDSWKETVISAKENQIIIKNEAGNMYFYKRYQKIEL